MALLREKNPTAAILTTPWDQLDGKTLLSAVEKVSLADELLARMQAEHEAEEAEHHHHHHDHDEHDDHDEHHHDHDEDEGHCCCGHHHDDDDDEHEHHHHEGCCHHDHEEHDHHHDHDEHEHHHHHDGECDDPECSCHHHHHHADEVFTSWGAETVHSYTEEDIRRILTALDTGDYGAILRAKGIVPSGGKWLHFDYVPEEQDVRYGSADYTGRLCVIGAQLKEDKLKELFSL